MALQYSRYVDIEAETKEHVSAYIGSLKATTAAREKVSVSRAEKRKREDQKRGGKGGGDRAVILVSSQNCCAFRPGNSSAARDGAFSGAYFPVCQY